MMRNKIKGILFDLDDTLFDCTGQLTEAARKRAAEVIFKEHPHANVATLITQQETLSQTLGSSGALKKIGQQYALPSPLIEKARLAYNLNRVEHITPFPDTHHVLAQFAQRHYKMALVTSGNPARQRSKVEHLHLTPYFNEKNGTLVLHDDHKSTDKTPFIQKGGEHLQLPNAALLAVGDKLDAEISAANSLGMTTVRIRHGRQKDRPPQTPAEQPDFEIDTLTELLSLLP